MRTIKNFVPTAILFIFVIAIAAIAGQSACAKTETAVATGGSAFVTCAKQDITQAVGSGGVSEQLVVKVVEILVAGAADWAAELTAIGAVVGADAIACATRAAVAMLQAELGSTANAAEIKRLAVTHNDAISRGQQFLSAVKFQ